MERLGHCRVPFLTRFLIKSAACHAVKNPMCAVINNCSRELQLGGQLERYTSSIVDSALANVPRVRMATNHNDLFRLRTAIDLSQNIISKNVLSLFQR